MEEAVTRLENGEITSSAFVAQAFDKKNKEKQDESESSPQNALKVLNQRQKDLEKELRSAVCANSDELLQNATDVKYLRDNVTNLKSQVLRVRREAENVASSILDPFQSVQSASIQLNSIYSTCNELRILQHFLSLTRQFYRPSSTVFSPVKKIDRISSEIKGLCDLWKISQSGDLKNIVVYQKLWEKIKVNCENMIKAADKQFNDSIEKLNVQSATISASVFIYLGTIKEVAKNNYYNKYLRNMNSNIQKYDKCSADTIFPLLQSDFQNAAVNISKISCVHESVSEALRKTSDIDIDFDIKEINPLNSISNYSQNLKQILTKVSNQYQNITNELVVKIPNIRKELFTFSQKLPSSIDQNSAFSVIAQVFAPYQLSFIKQTSEEIKKLFFKSFSQQSIAAFDTKAVALNCEAIQNRLLKLDTDLLWRLKEPVVQLAEQFVKMKKSNKETLREMADKSKEVVAKCLHALAVRLFSDDVGAQIDRILESS